MKSQAKIKMQKRIKNIPAFYKHINAVPQAVDNKNLPTVLTSPLKKIVSILRGRYTPAA